jgi:putative sporulation protein YtaF
VLWLSAALVASVSNLDNLAVGVAFGMRNTRIPARSNLLIAAVTMAGTAGAMTGGRALASLAWPSLASALGSSIICAIGVFTVVASLRAMRAATVTLVGGHRDLHAQGDLLSGDVAAGEVTSARNALVLGVALALNNVGAGVGAGAAGISPMATTLLAGALSLICLGGGSRIGWCLGLPLIGRWAPLTAGLILLGVGSLGLAGMA